VRRIGRAGAVYERGAVGLGAGVSCRLGDDVAGIRRCGGAMGVTGVAAELIRIVAERFRAACDDNGVPRPTPALVVS
jgi:hypothetical protein